MSKCFVVVYNSTILIILNCTNVLVDENNDEVDLSMWDDRPVFIKYNSSDSGDAYMKPYNGEYFGVLFQPVFGGDAGFTQYGDFPLFTFRQL